MPFQAYYLSTDGDLQCNLNEGDISAAFIKEEGLLWVDISENTQQDGEFLSRVFGFHPLTIEDCLSKSIHPPKVDDFDNYIFFIVHGVNYTVESDIVETTELAIFLGPHFVVSSHDNPLFSIQSISRLVEGDGRPMKRGSDFLVYTIVDTLVNNVMPTMDVMNDVTENIEEEVIRHPQQSTLEAILKLKRSTLRLHRVMLPQRDILNRLSRREFPVISDKAAIFYRDIYDHIVRIEDHIQSLRDRADNTLAAHLSSVANRQNETMRVLSIVATIFLPLGLLAGVYGMNFDYMPDLGWHWGYFTVVGFIGSIILTSLWFLWIRSWIARRRWRVSKIGLFRVDPQKLADYVGETLLKPKMWL
jgi:magnesium transporter